MHESRAEQSVLSSAPDIAVVDVGLDFYVQKHTCRITRAHKQMTRHPSPHPIRTRSMFDLRKRDLFLGPDQNLTLGIGFF